MKEIAYGKDFEDEEKKGTNNKAIASLEKLIATPKKNKYGASFCLKFQ